MRHINFISAPKLMTLVVMSPALILVGVSILWARVFVYALTRFRRAT